MAIVGSPVRTMLPKRRNRAMRSRSMFAKDAGLKLFKNHSSSRLGAQKDGRQVYEARVLVANESQLCFEGTSRLGNGTIRLQGTAPSFIRAQRFARRWAQRLHEAEIRTPVARPFFS